MQCPKCQTELPEKPAGEKPSRDRAQRAQPKPEGAATTPEQAYRADAPPGPCPQCGWSTMWNE